MSSPKEELKPCPFCGGEAIRCGSIDTGRSVECLDCHVQMHGPTRIERWNHRPSPSPQAGDFEGLREIIEKHKDGTWDALNDTVNLAQAILSAGYSKTQKLDAPSSVTSGAGAIDLIYEALGWKGGTVHQIVEEIKTLKEKAWKYDELE